MTDKELEGLSIPEYLSRIEKIMKETGTKQPESCYIVIDPAIYRQARLTSRLPELYWKVKRILGLCQ